MGLSLHTYILSLKEIIMGGTLTKEKEKQLQESAFDSIDENDDGKATLSELIDLLDPTKHDKVLELFNAYTLDEVEKLKDEISEVGKLAKNGKYSLDEFKGFLLGKNMLLNYIKQIVEA